MADKYDEQAERLLPMEYDSVRPTVERQRRFVAAALRELGEDRMRGNCKMLSVGDKCDCGLCVRDKKIADLRAELVRTQTALGQANADLMGCRDGALVRDLRAELDEYKQRDAEIASLMRTKHIGERKP